SCGYSLRGLQTFKGRQRCFTSAQRLVTFASRVIHSAASSKDCVSRLVIPNVTSQGSLPSSFLIPLGCMSTKLSLRGGGDFETQIKGASNRRTPTQTTIIAAISALR